MELNELKKLLEQRLAVIDNEQLRTNDPDLQLVQLRSVSEKIDAFYAEHGRGMPAKLKHFMENKSLLKALDFINASAG